MASMRNWLHGDEEQAKPLADKLKRRVTMVQCKAGKGRSGTVACSYLISQEGWSRPEALRRFKSRRMRAGFSEGPGGEEHVVIVDGAGHGNEVEGRADINAGKSYGNSMGRLASHLKDERE
jgi:hypothetical protein